MAKKGDLYLIPSLLGGDQIDILSPQIIEVVGKVDHYIVENVRSTRRFWVKLGHRDRIDDMTFHLLDKHKKEKKQFHFLKDCEEGRDMGIVSEAGCPAIADPGTKVVGEAHRRGIRVIPLIGPSSILLALMASGLSGQHFAFNGYLPIKRNEREKEIKFLESSSIKRRQANIFMEAPFRNNHTLESVLHVCNPNTLLCIATDISLETESIKTKSIREWNKGKKPELHKKPTIFILGT